MKTVSANPFRRAVVPLAFYYAVTLAVPLVNGAEWWGGRFLRHATAVLLVPLILSIFVYGICGIVSSICSRAS